MPFDEDYEPFAWFALLFSLVAFSCIFWAISRDDQKQRLKTYQDHLNTYILCVQKAPDKSICGKQPDIKNYL